MGKCYEYGFGIPQDRNEANKYFSYTARNGYLNAFFKLRLTRPIDNECVTKAKEFGLWVQRKENLNDNGIMKQIFRFLDGLYLPIGYHLNVHVAHIPPGSESPGDSSYFYIKNDTYESDIWNFIKLEISPKSVWQAYLIEKSPTYMPLCRHYHYMKRTYIYSTDDIPDRIVDVVNPFFDNIDAFINDVKEAVINKSLVPTIGIYDDIAIVSCCYWNNWAGLTREYVKFSFNGNMVSSITTIKKEVLYKYNCGLKY